MAAAIRRIKHSLIMVNSLTSLNLRNIASDANLRELIADYFTDDRSVENSTDDDCKLLTIFIHRQIILFRWGALSMLLFIFLLTSHITIALLIKFDDGVLFRLSAYVTIITSPPPSFIQQSNGKNMNSQVGSLHLISTVHIFLKCQHS